MQLVKRAMHEFAMHKWDKTRLRDRSIEGFMTDLWYAAFLVREALGLPRDMTNEERDGMSSYIGTLVQEFHPSA